jgi:cell division transport system ATP-binding protein
LIRLEEVSLRYGEGPQVLRRVSCHLEPGSFHYLLGASGAGKSSLLKLLYLAQTPSDGRLSLFGRDIARLTRRDRALMRRRIGVVFQDFRLIGHLSAFENVALPLRISGEPEPRVRSQVGELLSWVGLKDAMEALPPTLSGGQQQRVAIARAVIGRPSLLLADEPTGNVDDRIATRLLYLFRELNRTGTTVLLATHNEALAARMPQPRLRLLEGKLHEEPADTPPAEPAAPIPTEASGDVRGGARGAGRA